MQIKNKYLILILNSFLLLAITVNDGFWQNLTLLLQGKGGLLFKADAIAQMTFPLIVHGANLMMILFAIDSQIRLKKSWFKVNLILNSLSISLVASFILLQFFISTPFNTLISVFVLSVVVLIVPISNLLSLNDYRKSMKEIEEKIGLEGFNILMAKSIMNDVANIQILLENGSDVNVKDSNGYTSLMYAASNGCYEACENLIDSGADKELKTVKGNSAIDFAEKNGHHKIVLMLSANR